MDWTIQHVMNVKKTQNAFIMAREMSSSVSVRMSLAATGVKIAQTVQ